MNVIDEACTAVVPLQRICCDDLTLLKNGDEVELLWSDGVKYWSKFIVAGTFQFCASKQFTQLFVGSKTYFKAEEDF